MTLQEAQMKKYSDELTQIQLDTMLNKIGKVSESDKNIVTIDKYIFEIDRTVPKVVQYKGESDVVESGTGDSSGNTEENKEENTEEDANPSVETIILQANGMKIQFGAVGKSTTSEIDHYNYSITPTEGIPAEKVNGIFNENEMVEIDTTEENTYTIIITATDKNGKTTETKDTKKLSIITKVTTIDEILEIYSIEEIVNNKEAMTALGKSKTAKKLIMESDEWGKAIANSEYRKDFSEYTVYNANTLCSNGGRRNYYKKNDGIAITAVYDVNGESSILVGKNEQAVLGYSSYDTSYTEEARTLKFEGETWYYAVIPYGWADGTKLSNIYYGKNIGKMSLSGWDAINEAAIKLLEQFFNE